MNFVKNSINFTAGGKSVKTENDAIAPNGLKEATRFFSPASVKSTTFNTPLNPITFVTDKIYCRSIFVKPVSDNPEPRLLPFIIGGENAQHRLGIFNLKTKIFTWQYAQAGEVGTIFQANYKEYDNGWMRVWWNTKKTSTNTLGLNDYHMGGYGDGNNGSMWVWGAQVEEVATLNSEPGEYEQTGGDSLIFYNRDSNINVSQPITQLTYQPSYGSRVTFSSNLNQYKTSNGYYNAIPLSINSLTAKFDLRYDLNEIEAQKLIHFIENKNGVYDITFTDPSSLYKSIDGFCTEYAINHINKNHYEVAISLEVKESPNFLNWYSMNFTNASAEEWAVNTKYLKYDIVYYQNPNNLSNFILKSEAFDDDDIWDKSNLSATFIGKVLNPFNKYQVYKIQANESTTSLWHGLYLKYRTSPSWFYRVPKFTKKLVYSIYVKPNGKNIFHLGLEYSDEKTPDDTQKNWNYCKFNLSNLTVENSLGQIISVGNGWYRCVLTVDVKGKFFMPVLLLSNNAGTAYEYAATSSDGSLYIWGAQVQDNLTDYVKTDVFAITENKLNNFYYSYGDFNSLLGVDTQPGDALSFWRRDFFFEPDIQLQNTVNLSVDKINFKNSFSQNIKTQKNIAALNLTYKFTNITTQKAKAILHFLENKGGYRRFRVNMDSVYNKPKVFYSPSWTHTWKYENSHDIEVQLIEDPLGIIPKNS
jgi:phage-related protein